MRTSAWKVFWLGGGPVNRSRLYVVGLKPEGLANYAIDTPGLKTRPTYACLISGRPVNENSIRYEGWHVAAAVAPSAHVRIG
jgi:hypothetical protein